MGQRLRIRRERLLALLTTGTVAGFEDLAADWLSCEEALARILASASLMPATRVPAWNARGRSLSEPVRAGATLPAWRNSAMDGFAVRSAEVAASGSSEVLLPVRGTSYPGSIPLDGVPAGSAVRVMTGGPIPEGFDSVIRVEHTDGEASPGFVVLHRRDDLGKHVRGAGQDMVRGDETVPTGTVVHSGSLPVILASGCDPVPVFRRPRVGVLSSGDELVGTDRFDLVAAGKGVPDTNRAMIAAAVLEAGAVPVDLGTAPDDPLALRETLQSVEGVDVLVTTGGASMGERDLLKRILLRLSFRLDFWRARVRPGSPLSFGHMPLDGTDLPVFGLPGNPASAFVTFHVFVAPYLRARLGSPCPTGLTVIARTDTPLVSPPGLTQFYRVRLSREGDGREGAHEADAGGGRPYSAGAVNGGRCSLTGSQGSGLVRSLRDADGLAVVPEGVGRIDRDGPVAVVLLPTRS